MPYLVRRVLAALGVLLIASMVIFALLHLAPGSPANVIAGQDATPAQIAAVTHQLHLDQSLPVQYWHWLTGVLGGNLGQSYILHRPIGTLISQRLGSTLELMVAATIVMAFGTAITTAALAATAVLAKSIALRLAGSQNGRGALVARALEVVAALLVLAVGLSLLFGIGPLQALA